MIELTTIQTRLKAPKDKKNNFGDYTYRNVESICEAAKPLLNETKCTLTFTDDIIVVEGRLLIQAVATITNEKGESVDAKAYAEVGSHKGMSPEQNFGTASSYARKYAACALLLCDDSTDVDSLDNSQHPDPKPVKKEIRTAAKKSRTIGVDDTKAVEVIKDWILVNKKRPSVYTNYWKNTYHSTLEYTDELAKVLEDFYNDVMDA